MSDADSKRQALDYLLGQSSIYAQIIGDKLERERAARASAEEKAAKKQQQSGKPQQPQGPTRTTRHTDTTQNQTTKPSTRVRQSDVPLKRKRDKNDLGDVMSQQVSHQ